MISAQNHRQRLSGSRPTRCVNRSFSLGWEALAYMVNIAPITIGRKRKIRQ